MIRRLALALAFVLAACGNKAASGDGGPVVVAAASDLTRAFEEVGAAFTKKTGRTVTFSFGSTGLLARQIKEGAPFDVFAAANVSFVDDVVKAGACDGATKSLYARGRIAILTADGVEPPASIHDLADPKFRAIAIANPEHAPYGRAAREAMQKAGVWDQVESRMVYGENVSQAVQYARSGNVELAVIALSLAIVEERGYVLVDESLHAPIDQAMAVCGGGSQDAGAKAFVEFVASDEGREIMKRYGFLLPGEVVTRR
jgi:molybdate transport system substrate-binding protein